jgi:hypothetical protein
METKTFPSSSVLGRKWNGRPQKYADTDVSLNAQKIHEEMMMFFWLSRHMD